MIVTSVLFTLALFAPGCGVHLRPFQQGGHSATHFLVEDGQEKTFDIIMLSRCTGSKLVYQASHHSNSHVLVQGTGKIPGPYTDTQAASLWNSAPPWRRVENLKAIAQRLTADVDPKPWRFLLSNHNPIVIGITAQESGLNTLMLPGTTKRSFTIHTLYIYRDWPEPNANRGLLADREVIVLPQPLAIAELLDTQPWNPKPKPNEIPVQSPPR
jgi:hypothetical protein